MLPHGKYLAQTCVSGFDSTRGLPVTRLEEEEEEEAVFIRGVNTNEDSPNAQHAPHRPVQDTGAMSA